VAKMHSVACRAGESPAAQLTRKTELLLRARSTATGRLNPLISGLSLLWRDECYWLVCTGMEQSQNTAAE